MYGLQEMAMYTAASLKAPAQQTLLTHNSFSYTVISSHLTTICIELCIIS